MRNYFARCGKKKNKDQFILTKELDNQFQI